MESRTIEGFRAAWGLLFAAWLGGCAYGGSHDLLDADAPDTGAILDAGVDAGSDAGSDAGRDAGSDAGRDSGFDAGPPAIRADLYADTDFLGASRWVPVGDTPDLVELAALTSSVKVPPGYVLYGFSETSLGGTISGPITVDVASLAPADADAWRSVALRPTSEPFLTVNTGVNAGFVRYPLGSFPSLGAANNQIEGFTIPSGLTLVAYANPDFNAPAGVFVGPLATSQLPESNTWSSLVVRATEPGDALVQAATLYDLASFGGATLVLRPGNYRDLDAIAGVPAFRNLVSSARTTNALAVWGFQFPDFGGPSYGPVLGDAATIPGNNDWDSVVICDAAQPTITLYLDGTFTTPEVRPLVDCPNLATRSDMVDGILVPNGYRVFGFTEAGYGGYPRVHDAGNTGTSHDDWTSLRVVLASTPTVTIYLESGLSNGQTYPLGSYPDLQTLRNTIDGIAIPAGLRVCGFSTTNYTGTKWEIVGPTSMASIGSGLGLNDWDSMVITAGSTCP